MANPIDAALDQFIVTKTQPASIPEVNPEDVGLETSPDVVVEDEATHRVLGVTGQVTAPSELAAHPLEFVEPPGQPPAGPPALPPEGPRPPQDLIGGALDKQIQQEKIDAEDRKREAAVLKFLAENAMEPGRAKEVAKYAAAAPQLDPRFIEKNLEQIRRRFRYAGFDWEALLETHPVFTKMVGDPKSAPLVLDDAAVLTRFESVLTGKWEMYDAAPPENQKIGLHEWAPRLVTPPAWAAAVRDAFTTDIDLMLYQAQKFLGLDPGLPDFDPIRGRRYGAMTPLEEERARSEYEQYLREHSTGGRDYVGDTGDGTIGRAKRTVANAFLFPFKAAPMIAGTAVSGGLGGALGLGGFEGMAIFNSLWTAPGMYDRLSGLKNAEGQQISPAAARIATIIGAPLVGWVMTKGLSNTFTGAAEKALEQAGARTITTALSSRDLMLSLGEWGARTGVHVMEGAAGFAMQNGVDAGVEQLTRSWALGESANPDVVYAAMWEGFKQGLVDMPVLAAWHPGKLLLQDIGRIRRANETRTKFRIMADSKEAAAHPEMTERMAEETAASPGAATHAYVDRELFDATAQKAGLDPREVAAQVMEDGGAAYDLAVTQHAADLAIPIAKAQKHLVGSRVFGDMMEMEARFDPADYSFAKVMRDVERWTKIAQEASSSPVEKMEPQVKGIYQSEYDKAFKALDHPRYSDAREHMADAHARKVIAIVVGLMERTKAEALDTTLTDWYAKTFGKNGIWKAEVKDRPATEIHEKYPLGMRVEIEVRGANNTVVWMRGRVIDYKNGELFLEDAIGDHYLAKPEEVLTKPQKTVSELIVGPEVEISDYWRRRLPEKSRGAAGPKDEDWAGVTYTEGATQKMAREPREWTEVKGEKDDLGRAILARAKDATGRAWEIVELPGGGVSVKENGAYAGRYKTIEEAKKDYAEQTVPTFVPKQHNILIRGNGDELILAHEFAHAFSRVLADLAEESPELRKLYDEMAKGMGYKDGQDRTDNALSVREERLAHAFEQYLIEGKSPSVALAGVFAKFVQWGSKLAKDYGYDLSKDVAAAHWRHRFPAGHPNHDVITGAVAAPPRRSGPPGVDPLTPELRAFFDKFLATTEEIRMAQELAKAGMPFPAATKNMTDEEKKVYAEALKEMERNAQNLLLKQIVEATRRENSKFLKEELARFRKIVAMEVKNDLAYRAIRFFKDGTGLDPAATELMMGEDGKPLRLLDKDILRVLGEEDGRDVIDQIRELGRDVVTTDPARATDLEVAARILGFNDPTSWMVAGGDTDKYPGRNPVERLLNGLARVLPEDRYIEVEALRRLRDRYQTDLIDNPQELQQRALDAVVDEKMAAKVIKEMIAMARGLDPERAARTKAITPEAMTKLAERLVLSKSLRDIRPEAYVRALGTATMKARDFAKSGDLAKAWDASEGALLNIYMYKAARKIFNQFEKSYEQIKERTTSDTWRAKLYAGDRGGPGYRNLHDAILEAIGLRPELPGDRAKYLDDFLKLAQANGQEGQIEGWDPEVVRGLLAGTRPWKDLTPGEAANVFNAIINIAHLAADTNEIRLGDERVALDGKVQELVGDLERLPFQGKAPRDMALVGKTREPGLKLQSLIYNAEEFQTLASKMGAAWKRLVYDEYIRAKYRKFDLQELVSGKFKEAWDALPQEIKDKTFEELSALGRELPVPPDVNLAGPVSRSWLWMVMLNMGNAGNRQRMLQGMGWNVDQVLNAAQKYLSPAEMDFIQKIWDLSDKELWPLIATKEERRTGLPPDKVEALAFKLKFGDQTYEYRGGYFPAKYDPRAGERAVETASDRTREGPVRMRPGTTKSYTKGRVENYADIVNLEWSVLPSHMAEVIHDLAFDEFVRNTNKLIFNRKFKMQDVLYQRLGEEGAKQPRAFLEAVAHEQTDPVAAHMARSLGLLDAGRSRIVYGALGYNIPVAFADFLHPIAVAAFGRIRMKDMAMALVGSVPGNYGEMRAFAFQNSKELQIRARHSDAKLREELLVAKRAGAPTTWTKPLDVIRRNAFVLLDTTDQIVSTQIWTAKYREVMRDGVKGLLPSDAAEAVKQAEAIRQADDAVRAAMPTHILAEMPAILRDRKTMGALMIFQGYYSKLLQLSIGAARPAIDAWRSSEVGYGQALGETAVAAMRIAAGLGVASVMGDYLMGHGKEQGETWGQWWARKGLVAPFTMIPFASNLAEPLADIAVTGKVRKISVRNAPALAAIQQVYDTVGRLASDRRTEEQKLWDVIELALFAARLPSRQPRRTGEYITNMITGEEQPEGPAAVMSGLTYGKRRMQAANPITDFADFEF